MANLKERTGKSIEEWIQIVQKAGPTTERERREWLKSQHGITTNYAMWIAGRAGGSKGAEDYNPEALVDAMFSGPKAGLRPVYKELLKLGLKLGNDVKVCPCQTIVPFYRKHVFAQVKPRTRTQIDVGFALRDLKPTGRLEDTGGFAKKDRITHRIVVTSVAEIDDEVKRWLKAAYDLDQEGVGKAVR